MLILSDIDGVMVPAHSWKKPELLDDGFPAFSSKAVCALQRLISETDASILLATSHKSTYSNAEWRKIFEVRGIVVRDIGYLPDNTQNYDRKDEILNWFNSTAITDDFILIDDDKSLNALPAFLKEKLIQTSPLIGLTDELVSEALHALRTRGIPA